MTPELAIVVGAYLLGSVPTALLLVRAATGADVRAHGSGNIGATNALRTAGIKVGVVVTVVDVAKGALPVWAMSIFNPAAGWLAATMVAAVLGHCFPVWLRFRGGKGVATAVGAFLVLAPLSTLAAVAVWFVVLAIWRWVALASLSASAAFPIIYHFMANPDRITLTAACGVAVLIIVRHISNIRMLVAGTEPRIGDGDFR